MWHNYNFFLLANSLVLNLNYSVKYRNTLVVSLFVEEIENLQNCPIHCVSLARKGGRDMHINIYFCISMNSGDVNAVTRALALALALRAINCIFSAFDFPYGKFV